MEERKNRFLKFLKLEVGVTFALQFSFTYQQFKSLLHYTVIRWCQSRQTPPQWLIGIFLSHLSAFGFAPAAQPSCLQSGLQLCKIQFKFVSTPCPHFQLFTLHPGGISLLQVSKNACSLQAWPGFWFRFGWLVGWLVCLFALPTA